jgi:hypothetical protein
VPRKAAESKALCPANASGRGDCSRETAHDCLLRPVESLACALRLDSPWDVHLAYRWTAEEWTSFTESTTTLPLSGHSNTRIHRDDPLAGFQNLDRIELHLDDLREGLHERRNALENGQERVLVERG